MQAGACSATQWPHMHARLVVMAALAPTPAPDPNVVHFLRQDDRERMSPTYVNECLDVMLGAESEPEYCPDLGGWKTSDLLTDRLTSVTAGCARSSSLAAVTGALAACSSIAVASSRPKYSTSIVLRSQKSWNTIDTLT